MKKVIFAMISCMVLAYVPAISYAEKKINGSTTIKASRGATITKNFKVELGTEYTITNQ